MKERNSFLSFALTLLCLVYIIAPCHTLVADALTKKLKVGVLLPLSGGVAQMGEAFRRGFTLHSEETSGTSRGLDLIFEDHKYDGKTSVTALHKLKTVDNVDLVIVWGNTPSSAVAPVAEELGLPLLAVSFEPEAKGRKHVITFGPKNDLLVAKIAQQFRDWSLKEPAAVSVDIGTTLKGVNTLNQMLGGGLYIKIIANEETDFKTIISLLRARKSDGLLLFALPEQALTFIKQAATLKYKPKIIGGDVFADQAFRKEAVTLMANLKFVCGGVTDGFINRLKQRFQDDSYFYESASGYTLALLLERLQTKLSGKSYSDLIAQLPQVDTADVPVVDLKYYNDAEYGSHFVVGGMVYDANPNFSPRNSG